MRWRPFTHGDGVIVSWRQLLPTLCTLTAMLAGFLSILVSVQGMGAAGSMDPDRTARCFRWAAQLIMLAMILDGLDGNLARYLKGQSDFGAELDTYVDLTAFGIAPAVLIFAVTLQSKDPLVRVLLPSAVALSGVVRLARFKVKDPLRGQAGYAGLPITVNAGWVAVFVIISESPPLGHFSLSHGPAAALFLVGIFLFVVLQVTNLRYPKPTKNTLLFSLCALLVVLLCVLGFFRPRSAVWIAILMIVLGVIYVFIGPLFVKGVEAHRARREARDGGEG